MPLPRPTPSAALFVVPALAALAACGDPRPADPGPTAPRLAFAPAAACTREDAFFLQQQIGTLFGDARLRQAARDRLGAVRARCTSGTPQPYPAGTQAATLASAPAAAMSYAEWLLARRADGGVTSGDAFLWTYVSRLVDYVGYKTAESALALDPTGFARVCRSDAECQAEAPDGRKAIRIPAGALTAQPGVPFLVTGVAAECTPFTGASPYTVFGGCFEISIDPKPGASFRFARSGTVVELCTTVPNTPRFVTERRIDVYASRPNQFTTQGKLAQRSGRDAGGLTPVAFRPFANSILSGGDTWCDNVKPLPTPGGFSGALRDAGEAVLTLFRPRLAYAGHGGLGTLPGFVEETSVFGPLDGYVFNGDFEGDVVGQFPDTLAEMRRGTWSLSSFPDPSVAAVQTSALFGGKYLLLNQAGGNSASKDSLTFTGRLTEPPTTSDADSNRVVRLRFRAAILSSRAFDTRFEVRSTSGLLTTLRFADGASAQSGALVVSPPTGAIISTAPQPGTWTRDGVQQIEITVRLNRRTGRADVSVGLVGAAPLARYSVAATNLAQFSWVLRGRDGQVVGSDDYQIFDVEADEPGVAP